MELSISVSPFSALLAILLISVRCACKRSSSEEIIPLSAAKSAWDTSSAIISENVIFRAIRFRLVDL